VRARLYSTPREEEGVKVVFRKARVVQTLRAREKRGLNCRRERETEERRKKYSKKERKCLGFICYPKYWRQKQTPKSSSSEKNEAAKGFVFSLYISRGLLLRTTRKRGKPPAEITTMK
jgi:hypothetical protein